MSVEHAPRIEKPHIKPSANTKLAVMSLKML
jgi:hypothetical protein